MGASNSKIEEDKALQLCRERKKFVKQALDGRCSLAAAHAMYIQSLKNTGTALRKFVDPGAPIESSLYTSTNATPEPLVQTEKSLSHFSFSSPSVSQRIDAAETFSPSPSPPSSTLFQANHMKFRGSFSKKVEEKPPVPVTGTVTSSSTPQTITPRSAGKPEVSPFEASSLPPQTPPWDYFGFFHPIDNQFSIQEGKEMNQGFENNDDMSRLKEEEGIPELEDEDEKDTFQGREESQDSEDEFDEPPTDTLVRSFENLNRVHHCVEASASPILPSATSETDLLNGKKSTSPDLSPLRATSSVVAAETDSNRTPVKEDCMESKVARKDFFSSMKDIEYLFIKAHESGQEIPRMLEANKLHFRPIFPSKESGSISSTFLKACFSCGEDPSHVQEENPQAAVKYLTWHRTTSSRSSSSRNPLGENSKDDIEDLTGNLFDNFCMISGSHASTLDRLYAWERKLYDEVKASEMVRRDYDFKCKILRQLESKGESPQKIDKTRAVVKDLHSRIRVAIHRIDSISKRIEGLRDKELQPQLEELIAGLSRMWEGMSEYHKLQLHILSIADINGNTKISVSDLRRQITIHLEDELNYLSSSFMKWVGAQKSYLQSINGWLLKCVSFPQKSSRKKRRPQGIPLQYFGPPIYVTCGVWLDKLDSLPSKDLVDSIKNLAAETSRFLPRQEKKEGKDANQSDFAASWKHDNSSESAVNFLRDEVSQDGSSGFVQFKESLLGFCGKLNNFADFSVEMYTQLQEAIQRAKINYDQFKSQSAV